MDKERCAASDVGLEEADTIVGGVPAADDDVVELVAKEFVDDILIAAIDLKKVGEGADGRNTAFTLCVCTEDVANGVGGVAVFTDQRFKRTAAAVERCCLGAEFVAAPARLGLFKASGLERVAKLENLRLEPLEAFVDALEGER